MVIDTINISETIRPGHVKEETQYSNFRIGAWNRRHESQYEVEGSKNVILGIQVAEMAGARCTKDRSS